jgi:hypothetical protein
MSVHAMRKPTQPLTTGELLREAIAAHDQADAARRNALALIERLRRRWRDENPGTFMLPSVDQLRRELGNA